jgi:hypothetical protein
VDGLAELSAMNDLLVPRRFCGPPSSGNGGWTAGALAALVDLDRPEDRSESWPAIEVTLHLPPPLDEPMAVTVEGDLTVATASTRVASARVVDGPLTPVQPVGEEEARAAEAAYAGHASHGFPTCFVCGTERAEGDGLRIFPGPTADGRTASTWTPHPSLSEDWHTYVDTHRRAALAVTWSALDCPGGWAAGFGERLMVLGRMTARIDTLPEVGEPHVVVGERRERRGRKTITATSLYAAGGRLVGTAEQVWVEVEAGRFM